MNNDEYVSSLLAQIERLGQQAEEADSLSFSVEVLQRELRRELRQAQEEISEYEALAALQRKRERPWIALWQQETGKHTSLPDYGEFLGWLVTKLDALREQVAAQQAELIETREQGFWAAVEWLDKLALED